LDASCVHMPRKTLRAYRRDRSPPLCHSAAGSAALDLRALQVRTVRLATRYGQLAFELDGDHWREKRVDFFEGRVLR
jgi:hypothetical protein